MEEFLEYWFKLHSGGVRNVGVLKLSTNFVSAQNAWFAAKERYSSIPVKSNEATKIKPDEYGLSYGTGKFVETTCPACKAKIKPDEYGLIYGIGKFVEVTCPACRDKFKTTIQAE